MLPSLLSVAFGIQQAVFSVAFGIYHDPYVPKLTSHVPKSSCTEIVHPFVPKLGHVSRPANVSVSTTDVSCPSLHPDDGGRLAAVDESVSDANRSNTSTQ